ncbi:MAG TPA: RNA-binding cell elongation regulator Jag/EloR [Anaerolineales bacterium]|nr:RNA-binding cell elongation regulator Jag/EloR [Anaerolineales bacterium]
MNEHTTLEKIAPSVDAAIAAGLTELGLTETDVDVEILDEGSRGLLGIGGRQARVRLTVKEPQAASEPGKKPVAEKKGGEESASPASMDEAFAVLDDNLLFISRQTVVELLEKMKVNAHVEVRYGDPDDEGQRPVNVDIHGNDLGVLIGRRAEILNALQYVVNLIVSKQVEHWVQVVVDVEGYRARRERQLRQMAQRMADQAIKTGRRQVLEPMGAAERRIVHLELRDHPNVLTQSIGEEPARKVTIVPK